MLLIPFRSARAPASDVSINPDIPAITLKPAASPADDSWTAISAIDPEAPTVPTSTGVPAAVPSLTLTSDSQVTQSLLEASIKTQATDTQEGSNSSPVAVDGEDTSIITQMNQVIHNCCCLFPVYVS